ncbi:hypothetical protein CEXT_148151 [Caerostris extrusa]|uniref:Uncharacterized protein n=1 Tax=Caerostris extrusa TaxID=172846 RepID=A0AAV4PF09_CAEEX|nr:hypothetical protein CEXT_148151 [Caerostris extrusa]
MNWEGRESCLGMTPIKGLQPQCPSADYTIIRHLHKLNDPLVCIISKCPHFAEPLTGKSFLFIKTLPHVAKEPAKTHFQEPKSNRA